MTDDYKKLEDYTPGGDGNNDADPLVEKIEAAKREDGTIDPNDFLKLCDEMDNKTLAGALATSAMLLIMGGAQNMGCIMTVAAERLVKTESE